MKYDIANASDFESAMRAIQSKLDVKVDDATEAVAQAVADCAFDCLDRAVQRAPIESGDLRNSGNVQINGGMYAKGRKEGGAEIVGTVSPAPRIVAKIGFYLPYAHRQHEDLNYRHDRTDGYRRADGTTVNMVAGGQAKYLESVIVENLSKWRRYIKEAAKRGLEGK